MEHFLTHTFMEGPMSVFLAARREAHGYHCLRNLRTMLTFTRSHLDLSKQSRFKGK
jgi:hypothetical protein